MNRKMEEQVYLNRKNETALPEGVMAGPSLALCWGQSQQAGAGGKASGRIHHKADQLTRSACGMTAPKMAQLVTRP